MNTEIFGQPARFFDTRNKLQMLSPQRSAQPASHKKLVAVLPAAVNWIARRREMNFLNHAIGFQDEQILLSLRFDDGAVIAGTSNHPARYRQAAQQRRD